MAVSFLAVTNTTPAGTTTSATTTSITPVFPTGTAVGDRVFVIQGASNTAGTTPTDWTALAKDVQVGPTGTAPGAGTGRRYLSVYYRDYDGAWSMPAFTLTSAAQNSHAVTPITLRKSGFDTWGTPTWSDVGHDTTAGTDYAATVPSFATTSAAMLLVATALNDNASSSGATLTQTGATFASLTERYDNGTATGNDVRLTVSTAVVTTGATNTLARAETLSAASEGGTGIVQQTVTANAPAELVGYATVTIPGVASGSVTRAAVDASLGGTVTDGDGLIAVQTADTGVLADLTASTWTELTSLDGDVGNPSADVKIWHRTAASEPTSWAFGQNASSDGVVTVIALRGLLATTTDIVDAIQTTAAGTSRVTPTVDHAGIAGSIMLAGASVAPNNATCTFTSPGDMVELVDTQSTSWAAHTIAFLATPSDPTGTKTFTASTATQQGPGVQWAMVVPGIGGATVTGDAALAATATITAAGFVTRPSGAAVAATGTITAAGATTAVTGATLAATATIGAAGFVAGQSGAAVAATATITAAGFTAGASGAVLAATATVVAAGGAATVTGSAALAAVATVAAAGVLALSSGATLTGAASVTAAGFVQRITGATLAATATVTAGGVLAAAAGATLAATATATVSGTVGAVAALSTAAAIVAGGFVVRPSAAGLTAAVTVTAAGLRASVAAATLTAAATITATGTVPVLWGPPTGLTATPVSDTQIDLSWVAVAGASGYDLERDAVVIATDVIGTAYSDLGLDPSSTHTYRARSVRA